eukprot:m51a1_g1119 putative non-processive endoglucanase (491) ;mRNA; f:176824-178552
MRSVAATGALVLALVACSRAVCTDVAPQGQYTCAQQASWGKCTESWMAGFCDKSCGRCTATASSAAAPVTPTKADCTGIPTKLNGNVWAVGTNYAQHSWTNGWMTDFMNYDWNKWETKFAAIKTELADMKAKGIRVVRWWIFASNNDGIIPATCWSGSTFTKLPDHYVDNIEAAVNYAKSIGLLVYPTLLSFDWGKGANQKPEIINDPTARQAWIDNAITPIIDRLKNNPGVFAWDLCNEPEWIVAGADGGEPCGECAAFKLADMKALFNGIIKVMKAKGVQQPISIGSASLKFLTQKKLWNDMDLDFWDFHWYEWATPYFNPLTVKAKDAITPSKPIMIGEVMPDPSKDTTLTAAANTWCDGQLCTDHGRIITQLAKMGYGGYMPWAWTDPGFPAIPNIANHFIDFNKVCPAGAVPAHSSSATPVPTLSSSSTPVPTHSSSATPVPTHSSSAAPVPKHSSAGQDDSFVPGSASVAAVGLCSAAVVAMML